MKELRWNLLKNEKLKETRGASFEDLVNSRLAKVMKHPKHDDQRIILFEYRSYIWVVPFIEEDDYYFLKTLFPSRKYTRLLREEMT